MILENKNFRDKFNDYFFNKKQSITLFGYENSGKSTFIKNEILDKYDNVICFNLINVYTISDLANLIIHKTNEFFNVNFCIKTKMNDIRRLKTALMHPVYESDMRRYNLILIFENFDYVGKIHNDILKMILEIYLKSDIQFIFTIKSAAGIDIFKSPNSYFYNFAKVLELEKNDIDEYVEYIRKNLNNISLDMCKQIAIDCDKNLFYINVIISYLKCHKNITQNIYTESLKKMNKILYNYFTQKLDFLIGKKNLSDILFYIANDENVYKLSLENNKLKKANVKKELDILCNKGIVFQNKQYAKYEMVDKLLKNYVLKNFNKRLE